MKALDVALHAKISGTSSITSLLAAGSASVFYGEAEENALHPLVTYSEISDIASYTFGTRGWTDCIYQVQAITEGPSFALAKQIRDAIDAALSDASLTVSGYGERLLLQREGSNTFPETFEGRRFNHAGHDFRIWVSG